jgi:hypothetical protein
MTKSNLESIRDAKGLGNITAKYRWFAIVYLIFMFIAFPGFVFALSLAGQVPMLAPSVRGNILSRETTPTPTRGVNVEVKTELLCIIIVIPEI